MVDVDLCSRYAEEGLCFGTKENARQIAELPDERRVVIFREKTAEQIEELLDRYASVIKKGVMARYGFCPEGLRPSSNNNRDSADLYCVMPDGGEVVIEVKFGSYTDKAAGMKQFEEIFGTTVFTEVLAREVRKDWVNLIASEYPDMSKHTRRLISALNGAVDKFNSHMAQQNYILTDGQQAYMEEYLFNKSGSYESVADNYVRFETTKDGNRIVEAVPIVKGIGRWVVRLIEGIDMDDERPRVNIFVWNEMTGVEVKFVLNNKNDFEIKTHGIKVRSKYMVNSPSWNVWIKRAT